jgi:Arc/MetJ family transcription regulator
LRLCIDDSLRSAYHPAMRKHTTIDLDGDLVAQARQVLGTTSATQTIHAALEEVVRTRKRLTIAQLHPALTLADLDAMRAHRFAEDPAPYGNGSAGE